MQKLTQAEGVLGQTLGRLMMVTEAYPNLKANQTMMQLSEELTATENKVSFARQAYNDSVMDYNTAREVVPLLAHRRRRQLPAPPRPMRSRTPPSAEAPKVSFT